MTDSMDGGRRRLLMLGGLASLVVAALALLVVVFPPQAQAAKWHTKLSGSGGGDHYSKAYGPKTLRGDRQARLRFWTARVWEADDREWEYDWVRFRLIRGDTGKTVRTFGPYFRPTSYRNWRSLAVKLPAGGHPYRLQAISDDARFGFRLQQRY